MVRYSALKGLYDVERTIGCGGFAKVKLATHIATGEKVAIKVMDKNLLGDDLPRVKLELKALKTLSHEHICKLYQVIETETHFFIVIEYCSGGELFDHIVEKNKLSESESRVFFRQIVSAVAYLHSLGYAHRDLKPENVLLDKNQNLKLIDFGLCARPEGGMDSPLFTSCGSPTYAAPELVLGQQYLGQEVDVWAMGVLLYALLVGVLPFDDLNIDSLYKKILSGKYEEPSFLSKESKSLIKSMLQIDPKKRITINELLTHHWLTLGVLDINFKSENTRIYDEDCVKVMAKSNNLNNEEMWKHLKKWKYDYHTATYFLLLSRKKRGSNLKLNSVSNYLKIRTGENSGKPPLKPLNLIQGKLEDCNSPITPKTPLFNSTPKSVLENVNLTPNTHFVEPQRPSSIRKPQKRIRSPTIDGDNSPVPVKKPTPGKSSPLITSYRKRITSNSDTPSSTRGVLGSIERSLNKVRHVLTPRKTSTRLNSTNNQQPVSLTSKDLCNVSTTQCYDPEFVIGELSKGLEKKGIVCQRKGFTLRGKLEPNVIQRFGGCSFELEVCFLPTLGPSLAPGSGMTPTKSILKNGAFQCSNTPTKSDNIPAFVGIRRKRLKGDSWCYKKVCEQVLALTSADFRQVTESTV